MPKATIDNEPSKDQPVVVGHDIQDRWLDDEQHAEAPSDDTKTDRTGNAESGRSSLRERMDGDYEPPILTEPRGGPIPSGAVKAAAGNGTPEAIQQQWEQAKADLLDQWPATAQPMVDELADEAEAAVADDDLGALGSLAVSAAAIAAVTLLMGGKGASLARDAAAGVVAEAASQGITIDAPGKPGAERVRQTADAVAHIIAAGYASGAGRAALQLAGADPVAVRDAVGTRLTQLASGGLVADNVGALLASAQYAGRLAVLEAHPADSYVAIETNDGPSRCRPCSDIEGKVYDTLAEGLVDYPNAGGTYRHCQGRDRCHGHLQPHWT